MSRASGELGMKVMASVLPRPWTKRADHIYTIMSVTRVTACPVFREAPRKMQGSLSESGEPDIGTRESTNMVDRLKPRPRMASGMLASLAAVEAYRRTLRVL